MLKYGLFFIVATISCIGIKHTSDLSVKYSENEIGGSVTFSKRGNEHNIDYTFLLKKDFVVQDTYGDHERVIDIQINDSVIVFLSDDITGTPFALGDEFNSIDFKKRMEYAVGDIDELMVKKENDTIWYLKRINGIAVGYANVPFAQKEVYDEIIDGLQIVSKEK